MKLILANLTTAAALLAIMGVVALAETVVPLRRRGASHRAHVGPNLALTLLTFVTNVFLNAGAVMLILWLDARGIGLLRWVSLPGVVTILAGIVVLDFAWYVLHAGMHAVPALWRVHRVHHSDPVVDVTTTIRQHPLEGLLRYASIAAAVTIGGVGLAAFTIYRVWSALNGLLEHSNVRLPRWLDRAYALVSVSPDMHKVHHSRDVAETDSNYGNIFSFFDRLFGTFTTTERGRGVVFGLDGHDDDAQQSTRGLLAMPFDDRVPSEPARASS